ncbi:MAG TPA: hypothetical protein EYQ83_09075 [Acidobacteria bacterium]|nr:hypothetical protein [Acidobacteriota bacterium]
MHRFRIALLATVSLAFQAVACADEPPVDLPSEPGPVRGLMLAQQSSGTDALLQAVSPVTDEIVWVSGHDATYAHTADGGRTWTAAVMPDAEGLQFRDVAAFNERTAYLMSAGTGALSRIYRTDDGGRSWALQYTADHADAFLDCIDFWDVNRGLAYGDAIDGVPFLLITGNGGATWERVPAEALPAAQDGEGGFAASGTCVTALPDGRAWVAMGNAERARVLGTSDYGRTWAVTDVPVVGGDAAGLTTVQVMSDGSGMALGGQIGQDSLRTDNVAITTDGGVTWTVGGTLVMEGPVYGSALLEGGAAVAVGPRGLDWSADGGGTWQSSVTLTYWAVAFSSSGSGWAVGPGGRITKLSFMR